MVRVKMQRILGWLCRTEWLSLSDHDFACKLLKAYEQHAGRCLVDPNE